MKKKFVLFTFGKLRFVYLRLKFYQNPATHSSKMLDPYPDITNADPKHWTTSTVGLKVLTWIRDEKMVGTLGTKHPGSATLVPDRY
jgi:hypothetical protein